MFKFLANEVEDGLVVDISEGRSLAEGFQVKAVSLAFLSASVKDISNGQYHCQDFLEGLGLFQLLKGFLEILKFFHKDCLLLWELNLKLPDH